MFQGEDEGGGLVTSVWLRIVALLCAGALTCAGCGADRTDPEAASSGPEMRTPLIGSVPFPPVPFAGSDGRTHLVYELWVTNFTSADLTVNQIQVLDAGSDRVVEEFDAEAVRRRLQPAGSREAADRLGPGQSGTVFIHLAVADDAVPDELVHEADITSQAMPPGNDQMAEQLGATLVDRRSLPVLSAPLSGERYVAADGCCDSVWHTRAVLPIDGSLYLAQRYAIDYEQMDENGRLVAGDPGDVANYAIYGTEVLAVADGTVVSARNDLPEQKPGSFPADIPLDEADGNSVVLDIGDGFYASYAHMQQGSVRPVVGDEVRRGDVIGLVGNTGNTVAPHLHFHVMNGPSALAAQGLPYLYDRFSRTGQVADSADLEAAESQGVPLLTESGVTATDHTDQLVMDRNIVTFTP